MANEPNYSSNPSKDEPKKEKVRVIPLEYIDEFPGHPFKVLDDESMQKLMNSIEEIGVQSPIVARIKAACLPEYHNDLAFLSGMPRG